MNNDPQGLRRLSKYCVVCGKEWGPSLAACCTPGSLLLVKDEGLFRRSKVYFDLSGRRLGEQEMSELRQREKELLAHTLRKNRTDQAVERSHCDREAVPFSEEIYNNEVNPQTVLLIEIDVIKDQFGPDERRWLGGNAGKILKHLVPELLSEIPESKSRDRIRHGF